VIDDLLSRPDFQDVWVMKWGEMLQIRIARTILRGSDTQSFAINRRLVGIPGLSQWNQAFALLWLRSEVDHE
jgi:hypothetical protein